MQPGKRRRQIQQRRLWRKKNRFFLRLSNSEKEMISDQEWRARNDNWAVIEERGRDSVEAFHKISFKGIIGKLKAKFPKSIIQVLDEGAGRSSLKREILSDFGSSIDIITSDIRKYDELSDWPDKQANVMDLVKSFGRSRFHLIVSTYGGAFYSPLPEKALFQIVSVLKPGGIGIIHTTVSEKMLRELAGRWNISIIKKYPSEVIFIKNISRRKK